MNKLLLSFLLLISHLSISQVVLRGTVIDEKRQIPIAYANIGIINTSVGTISNADGSFEIYIPKKLEAEPIIFSAIGYERVEISASNSVGKKLKIKLKQKTTVLRSVEVKATAKLNKEWYGNNKKGLFPEGTLNYDSASAGGAIALLIEKDDTTLNFVEEARLFIMRNTLPEFKIRIRFLEVDSLNNNKPGKDLLGRSIVVTSSIRKGWLEFDLSEYNIYIEPHAFYLEFEWLYEDVDRHFIAQSYSDFIKSNPEDVSRDTVIVDNIAVPIINVKNHIVGTFVAVSSSKKALEQMVTYGRASSFSSWERDASIVRAKVLMTD